MRNILFMFCTMVTLLCMNPANAQETTSENVPTNSKADSFADIATLGEEIAIAQRKMQALTLKNSLDALEAQQEMGNFSFKVLRVEGFNDTLYAILMDDAGVVYQVGPGDLIANQYRVSLIRPYSVGVFDINTQKTYAVPFAIGGMEPGINDLSNNENVGPTVAPSPPPATTAK